MSSFLQELAEKTGLQYFPFSGMFRGSKGCLIGFRDNYLIGIGVPQQGNNKSVSLILRTKDTSQANEFIVKMNSDKEFKKLTNTAIFKTSKEHLTWSFVWPLFYKTEKMAAALDILMFVVKQYFPPFPINKCEECGQQNSEIVLLNGTPNFPCPTCRIKLREKYDKRKQDYLDTKPRPATALVLGLIASIVAGFTWGALSYVWVDPIKNTYEVNGYVLSLFLGLMVVAYCIKLGIKRINLFSKVIAIPLGYITKIIGDSVFISLIFSKSWAVLTKFLYLLGVMLHWWQLQFVVLNNKFTSIFTLCIPILM